jgi:hypothetical protein
MAADAIPAKGPAVAGLYYARVLPVLTTVAVVHPVLNGKGVVVGHTVKATVTDAGDLSRARP